MTFSNSGSRSPWPSGRIFFPARSPPFTMPLRFRARRCGFIAASSFGKRSRWSWPWCRLYTIPTFGSLSRSITASWFSGSPNHPPWLYSPTVQPSFAASSAIGRSTFAAASTFADRSAPAGSPVVTHNCVLTPCARITSSNRRASASSAAGNQTAVSSMFRFLSSRTSWSKVGRCSDRWLLTGDAAGFIDPIFKICVRHRLHLWSTSSDQAKIVALRVGTDSGTPAVAAGTSSRGGW